MRYIFIGIIFSGFLLNSSCKKSQWLQYAEYQYVNQTNYTITFPKGFTTRNPNEPAVVIIKPNTITVFKLTFDGNKKVTADSYYSFYFVFTDTYKRIFFDNLKCLDLFTLTVNNPSDMKNYVAERIDKRTFKFTYTFTEADYNRAVTCP